MAYTKHTWVNGGAPAINASNLNAMETGIYNADNTANTVKTNFNNFKNGDFKTAQNNIESLQESVTTMNNKVKDIGATKEIGGSSSLSNKTVAASETVDLGSMSLSAGTWVIMARCRFTPNESANHYSSAAVSTTSGNTAYQDRRYGSGTMTLQHSFCNILTLSSTTTIYLSVSANVAGTWTKTTTSAYIMRAVRIA